MSRRKLSRQQRWRVEKIQAERTERALKKDDRDSERLDAGEYGAEQPGRVAAHFGRSLEVESVEDDQIRLHRCHLRANLEGLVTGDQVTVDQEHTGIPPVLALNKSDLLPPEGGALRELLARYDGLGYPLVEASARGEHGLDALQARLAARTSVFVGQSGVGKSSLIDKLLPDETLRIGALSTDTRKGKHTTTTARLYPLPLKAAADGARRGDLIDSPGIREFGLWHLDERELAEGFIEFRPFLGHCRFRDCRHRQEPGCALIDAVERGDIHPQRFASFQRIRDDIAAS